MHRGGGRRGGGGYRGKSPRSAGYHGPVGAQFDDASLGNASGSSQVGMRKSETTASSAVTKQVGGMSISDNSYKLSSAIRGGGNITPNAGHGKVVHNVREAQNWSPNLSEWPTKSGSSSRSDSRIQSPVVGIENCSSPHTSRDSPVCGTHHSKEPSQIIVPTFSDGQSPLEGKSGESGERDESDDKLKNSTFQQKNSPFDICPGRSASGVKLKRSLLEKNRERRNEMKNHMEGHNNIDILRPGMVLLRGFLSFKDQVKLIKTCQDLGLDSGGFYQPGYSDGAKLHLKMMCLGKNWDPETSMYSDERPSDRAKPPVIPDEFQQLVKGAIRDCHACLESHANVRMQKILFPQCHQTSALSTFMQRVASLVFIRIKMKVKRVYRNDYLRSLSPLVTLLTFYMGMSGTLIRQRRSC